jgi:hypothetical protein
MKDLLRNWKFWLVVAIVAAVVIAAVVCHLVQPKVTYAWLEIVSAFTFLSGVAVGCIIDCIIRGK